MKTKKHKAWTLLEVMVVIAIITILTSISLAYLSSIRPNARLKAAQRELASAIRQAQSYALEGKMIGSYAPPSFGVYISGSGDEYRIIWGNDQNNLIETVNLTDGITFSKTPASVAKINFKVPEGTMSFSPPSTALFLTITLKNSGGSTATVTVKKGGTVVETD